MEIAVLVVIGLAALLLGFIGLIGAVAVFPITLGAAILGWLLAGQTGAIIGASMVGIVAGFSLFSRA